MEEVKVCLFEKKIKSSDYTWSGLLIGLAALLLIPVYEDSAYGLVCVFWALLGLAPIIGCLWQILRNGRLINYFVLLPMSLTWSYFCLPFLAEEKIIHLMRVIPENFEVHMVGFCSVGIWAIYLGYYLTCQHVKPMFSTEWRVPRQKFPAIFLSLFCLELFWSGIVCRFFPEMIGLFGFIAVFIEYIPMLSGALLVLYWLRGGRNWLFLLFGGGYFLFFFFVYTANTLFIRIIILSSGLVVAWIFERKRVPFFRIALLLLLLYPLYMSRGYYRRDAVEWWYFGKEISSYEMFLRGVDIVNYEYTHISQERYDTFEKELQSRMEQLSYLGQCVWYHEIAGNSYRSGSTFWWLPLVPIPRIIFPVKPVNDMHSRLAREYGNKGGGFGAMNFPLFVEYYINFGFFAIVFLAFFQGMAYRFIVEKEACGNGDLNLLALLSVALVFINVEVNITLIFGQVLTLLLMWYFASLTFLQQWRYSEPSTTVSHENLLPLSK